MPGRQKVPHCTALLIPRLPECTGSDACAHALSLRLTFTITLTRPLCSLSKECSRGEENRRNVICIIVWEWKRHVGGRAMRHEHGGNFYSPKSVIGC